MAERYALTRAEAAKAIGLGLTTFEAYVQPHLRLIRVGRKVLVPASEIERWIAVNVERPMAEEVVR